MKVVVALLCLLCFADRGYTLKRNLIRQQLAIHRLTRSATQDDAYTVEEVSRRRLRRQTEFPSDDEDITPEASGDESDAKDAVNAAESTRSTTDWAWYRTKINFLDSIKYSENLKDHNSEEFSNYAHEIMVAVEEHLRQQLDGYHEATPLMFSMVGDDVVVLVDVGMCMTYSINDIAKALRSLVSGGMIGRFRVSGEGFSIRQIGVEGERSECKPGPSLPDADIPLPTPEQASTTVPFTTTTEQEPPGFDVGFDDIVDATKATTTAATTTTSSSPANAPPISSVAPPCRFDQATCKNLQCIDRSYVCDGSVDCLDGSDEPESCSNNANDCDPTEFLCVGTGVCAQKLWRCDGDDDCGNGFDELDCPAASPETRCSATEFECRNQVCIRSSYQCDGDSDCEDGSDEEGCSPPVVTSPPEHQVSAQEGDTVTLECEAIGTPAPVISWRLNWANVPPPPRVTMSSSGGKGTLTIRKVKPSDQGAYTCEAINPGGNTLGTPDAILSVQEKPEVTPEPVESSEKAEPLAADVGLCPPGEFNTSPNYTDECRPCFCFGVTDQCASSRLEFSEISIEFTKPDNDEGVTLEPTEDVEGSPETSQPITENQINVNPPARELQLIDLSKRFLAAAHYWSLPAQFLGAKINSYGGTLTFSFSYNNSYHVSSVPTNHSDVILEGNGKTLVYESPEPHPEPVVHHTAEVTLDESQWKKLDGQPTSREEMMEVLGNLDRVLIRTVYDNAMLSTGISDVKLQVAEPASSSRGDDGDGTHPAGVIAYSVEECECPDGYEGLSCQTCSTGYERVVAGPLMGKCVPEQQGDSPASVAECDVGYTGPNCEECASGYMLSNGRRCVRKNDNFCSDAGSTGLDIDLECLCKEGTRGEKCDECKPGYYFLSRLNDGGCLPCFCMGVTKTCNSTKWNVVTLQPAYKNTEPFVLTNPVTSQMFQDGIAFENGENPSVTVRMDRLPNHVYYWMLPKKFTGNLLASYGGNLDYTVSYSESAGARPTTRVANVQITGNDVTLQYVSAVHPAPGAETRFIAAMRENQWLTQSGRPVTREELLMVLSNVEKFLVRASYSDRIITSKLKRLYLHSSSPHRSDGHAAMAVEQCVCPRGYTGLSCEECAAGFYRVKGGSYLGTCVPCNCHGHSNECDRKTGTCRNCRHNTDGEHCEVCARGYFGIATEGTRSDCRLCTCPGTRSNSFSDTCRLETATHTMTCTNCQEGYVGQRCERCTDGYEGSPSAPGGRCVRRVSQSPRRVGTPPEVTVSPKMINAREGTGVTLRCSVSSTARFAIMWRRSKPSRAPLPSDVIISSNKRTLRIPSFTRSHAGSYECIAKSRYGADKDTAAIAARRENKMIKVRIEEPRHLRVRVGGQASFRCTATSRTPAYIVSWSKEENRLPFDRATDFDGVLHLTNIRPSDSGTYICTGSNMYTTDRETATLTVVQG